MTVITVVKSTGRGWSVNYGAGCGDDIIIRILAVMRTRALTSTDLTGYFLSLMATNT